MRIVIPTQKTKEEYKNTTEYKCVSCIVGGDFLPSGDIDIIEHNKIGLSKLYNEKLFQYKDENYVVFIHDDLEIHDRFFWEKLKTAHKNYDIIGLAGATSQDYTTPSPSVWHLSKQKPADARGIVSHYIPKGFQGVTESHYNSAYFGPTPSRVCVIDGLFISVKISALNRNFDLFDVDFDWHHYDMAMCYRAIQRGLKIGVWPIFCVHHGLGEFQNDLWRESDRKFKAKYGNYKFRI